MGEGQGSTVCTCSQIIPKAEGDEQPCIAQFSDSSDRTAAAIAAFGEPWSFMYLQLRGTLGTGTKVAQQ
jgi:hypothetical protein